MCPDSVSFTLWRQSGGSATDYAVMSSVDGFAAGEQLEQVHLTTVGATSQFELTGAFANAQPTTAPVEFRLYGWNAANALDDTHMVGASMRARFASVIGSQIDPTGELTVRGDFYHLAGGMLAIDLGGTEAGVNHDFVEVLGKVDLAGDLNVSLVDGAGGGLFSPQLGDSFEILAATGGVTGQFANILLPTLATGLDWFVNYSASSVWLDVLASADFNRDGVVDGDDLTLWKAGAGMASNAEKQDGDANDDGVVDGADLLVWQQQFGSVAAMAGASAAVPEPGAARMVLAVGVLMMPFSRRPQRRCDLKSMPCADAPFFGLSPPLSAAAMVS
jgi:hypothetical protein